VTNGVGRVWVAGLAVAQVNLTDAAHKFCDLAASPGPLTSAVTGPARILWSNGVASPTWCIIRFEGSGIVGDETWIGSTTGGVKSKDLLRDANGNQVVGHNAQGPITTTPGPVSALSDWRGAFDTSLTMPDHGFTITPYTDNVDANGHSTLVAGAPFYIKFDPAEVPGFTDTDELVACSANDTTPDYLHEKLETWVGDSDHIAVEWETQNDGGDEQERLKINKTDVGGGFAKSLDVWVRVTANTAKTYVSTDDWRGRMFHILGAYSDTNVSDANGQPWVSQAHSAFLVGTNFDARGGYGDVTVASVAAGRGNVSLGIEDDTGQLFVEVTSYSAEFQVRFLVQATNVKSAADVTVT
ncbi:MAG: hypothetical protein IMZ50_06085, partial [Candidatus Atribacteria bacterium]|nr:hypothetical protein [Candidatus Atribacteria bacterium]